MMNKIKLMSSDGRVFVWSIKAAQLSKFMANILEDSDDVTLIPLPCVDSNTLEMVQKYCEYHRDDHETDLHSKKEERDRWDMNYLSSISKPDLDAILMAALEIDIMELIDACCKVVANKINGMPVEEIRSYLKLNQH